MCSNDNRKMHRNNPLLRSTFDHDVYVVIKISNCNTIGMHFIVIQGKAFFRKLFNLKEVDNAKDSLMAKVIQICVKPE